MRIVHQDSLSLFDGKVCRVCGIWKPFEQYYIERQNRDGRVNYCRTCGSVLAKAAYIKYKPRVQMTLQRYRAEHKETLARKQKEWARKNPEKVAIQSHRYRARINQAEGTYSHDEWTALCERYDNRCLCCNRQSRLTVDHVVPLSKGGSNSIDNIQPLCEFCNKSKHDRTIDYRQTKTHML